MISVCIPVYNFDVSALVEQLHQQLSQIDQPSEIILIDDASDEEFRRINRKISPERITLIEHEKNTGRARIRNRFLEYSNQPNLLFLDCDTTIPSGRFINDYLKAMEKQPGKIICGGSIYNQVRPSRKYMLHWNYGRKKESRTAATRSKNPNASFMTANFLVPRILFEKIRFDESITGYGHEDTLFGFSLMEKGHIVVHIDNPVVHEGLETNAVFLDKTDEGLRNLNRVAELTGKDPEFLKSISLLNYISRLDRNGTAWLIRILFFLSGPLVRALLASGRGGIKLFSFYKLGKYLSIRISGNKKVLKRNISNGYN